MKMLTNDEIDFHAARVICNDHTWQEHLAAIIAQAKLANELQAKLEAADAYKKDAERYRWLKRQHDSPYCCWHVRNGYTGLAAKNIPDDLNAEIDAAIAAEGK